MKDVRPATSPLGRNRDNLRQHNLGIVLRLLHETGSVPRTYLTSVTGLNRSTISDLVGELEELGLARESEAPADGRIGRPSLSVAPADDVVAFAVNPETDAVTVGVVTLAGRVVARLRYPTPYRPDPATAVQTTARLIAQLRDKLPDRTRIAGVGAAVPGQIRVQDGVVRFAPHLEWVEAPFRAMLEQLTDLPVAVDNDAACAATAERLYGSARGSLNSVFLWAGSSGIGGGVVAGGRLLRGATGYAGELGHVRISSSKALDLSGVPGTLEALVRRDDLLEVFRIDSATDEELDLDIQSTKDRAAIRVLQHQVDDLGRGIGALATVFNPELVVLGGFLGSLFRYDAERLLASVRANSIAASHDGLVVKRSELGTAGVLVGAAELAFTPLLTSPAGTQLVAK